MALKENINKGCLKCEHCIPEVNSCACDSCIHGVQSWLAEENKIKSHKCYGCPWGTFVTNHKYLCMLPKCNRNLGKTME